MSIRRLELPSGIDALQWLQTIGHCSAPELIPTGRPSRLSAQVLICREGKAGDPTGATEAFVVTKRQTIRQVANNIRVKTTGHDQLWVTVDWAAIRDVLPSDFDPEDDRHDAPSWKTTAG